MELCFGQIWEMCGRCHAPLQLIKTPNTHADISISKQTHKQTQAVGGKCKLHNKELIQIKKERQKEWAVSFLTMLLGWIQEHKSPQWTVHVIHKSKSLVIMPPQVIVCMIPCMNNSVLFPKQNDTFMTQTKHLQLQEKQGNTWNTHSLKLHCQ